MVEHREEQKIKGKRKKHEEDPKNQLEDEINALSIEDELNEEIKNYICKKKLFEKNIAEVELNIQKNKLQKLIQTKKILLDVLTTIKKSKYTLNHK